MTVGKLMEIKKYISGIKNKIDKINSYITNPVNYKDINNPFSSNMTKTYVWIDEDICKKRKC